MTWIAQSLWDLVAPAKKRCGKQIISFKKTPTRAKPRVAMQGKYDAIVEEMKATHNVRVRKWRKSSSGVAWTIRYLKSGRIVKLIEAPYPRGPMSCSIFLHEIGHHAIGLGVYRPRCLEEYHVWMWAIALMRERGFNVTAAVERRVERSMRYAVAKAKRRGIQDLPCELLKYA